MCMYMHMYMYVAHHRKAAPGGAKLETLDDLVQGSFRTARPTPTPTQLDPSGPAQQGCSAFTAFWSGPCSLKGDMCIKREFFNHAATDPRPKTPGTHGPRSKTHTHTHHLHADDMYMLQMYN